MQDPCITCPKACTCNEETAKKCGYLQCYHDMCDWEVAQAEGEAEAAAMAEAEAQAEAEAEAEAAMMAEEGGYYGY